MRDNKNSSSKKGAGQSKGRNSKARNTFKNNGSSESKPKKFFKPRGTSASKPSTPKKYKSTNADAGLTRLNKFLSNAGVCSRREADKLIASGVVTINGKTITELGTKVAQGDVVHYGDQKIKTEKHVYLLLNKPKGFITTVNDPQKRRTVMNLVENACKERVYPVGRLDKETTGLLMLTNDGDLTRKLTHPRFGVKKIYHVTLNKNISKNDLAQLVEGVELEDGFVKADEVSYVGEGKDRKQIGIELHSGKNRIIRRMIEQIGYSVEKLDRVFFAGLTKKNILRGKYRFLNEDEIAILKRLG